MTVSKVPSSFAKIIELISETIYIYKEKVLFYTEDKLAFRDIVDNIII